MNHGRIDLLECDALLKAPLLSAWLAGPFYVFGTKLEVARASVLLCTLIALMAMLYFKELYLTALLFICTTLLLFPVFEYAHLALSEMCAIASIIISGLCFMKFQKTENNIYILWSSTFLFAAFLFKIQFVYIFPVLPISVFLYNAYQKKIGLNKTFWISICLLALTSTVLFSIYYLPFKDEFNLIFTMQSASYNSDSVSYEFLKQNIESCFLSKEYLLFTLAFAVALIIAVWQLATRNINSPLKFSIVIFTFVWIVLELHKLPMAYLPVRYIISTYVAMGLFTSLVFANILTMHGYIFLKIGIGTIVMLLLLTNTEQYVAAHKARTFAIKDTNNYLAAQNLKSATIIGPWAPSLTWESGSTSFPIWKDLLRTKKPLETFKPDIVISEYNEEDSGEAYRNLNIDLNASSDSIKAIKIAYWNINLYWIKKQIHTAE
jgi:hypothetical protein